MKDTDSYLPYIERLYKRSLSARRYHHLGGLDDYLTKKLTERKPANLQAALQRLRMAWSVLLDISMAAEDANQCGKAQVCRVFWL